LFLIFVLAADHILLQAIFSLAKGQARENCVKITKRLGSFDMYVAMRYRRKTLNEWLSPYFGK
jgi:hypothetical protein|tara:strand:- start:67 stop:255 length:189 start_codon:yes stop_codon:yes gene_type:complete